MALLARSWMSQRPARHGAGCDRASRLTTAPPRTLWPVHAAILRLVLVLGVVVWATVGQPGPAAATTSYVSTLYGVSCPSAQFCVAVGGGIIASDTGGRSWTDEPTPSVLVSGIAAKVLTGVWCTSHRRCIAVGYAGIILTTSDGGVHWVQRPVPAGTWNLAGIACSSADACIAVGEGGSF
jgi:photosystem II stability/assembly factor-like uncharacterized protein